MCLLRDRYPQCSPSFTQVVYMPVVVQRQGPLLQFFAGCRHSCRDSEADPHGPDDHIDSPVTLLFKVVDVHVEVVNEQTVVVPQLQLIEGRRHHCRDAEVDPHGQNCSEDPEIPHAQVRTLETQCLGHLFAMPSQSRVHVVGGSFSGLCVAGVRKNKLLALSVDAKSAPIVDSGSSTSWLCSYLLSCSASWPDARCLLRQVPVCAMSFSRDPSIWRSFVWRLV